MTDAIPTRAELNAILRSDPYSFTQAAFRVVEPASVFVGAPYLQVLCHSLTQVTRGKTNRLVINLPPRHLKSIVTSVIWVAWMLAKNPSMKIAIVCHNDILAGDLALKCKRLIESDWYRQFAPQVRIKEDRNRTRDFELTGGGGVFSVSIGSGITGRGFHIIILDDPQAASDATSEVERNNVTTLYNESISSRLDDPVRGVIILVQQRLHEDDLSGHLLARTGWTLLRLPLIATETQVYSTGNGEWRRSPGDVLCPERLSLEEAETLRATSGPQIFETQYQQTPGSFRGEMIKDEYLKSVPALPPSATRYFVSVDTAMKTSDTADYTAFLIIATDGTRHYIVDVIRARVDVAEMRDIGIRLHQKYQLERFLIEESASGPSLCSLLREQGQRADVVGVGGKDKQTRLQNSMHLFVEGRIFIVGDAPWTAPFRDELMRFPIAKYDDQVDALTLYLQHFTTKIPVKPVILSARGSGGWVAPSLYTPPMHKGEHPMRPWNGKPPPRRRF